MGLCPKTPVAGCAGYGLISGGSRKSIRTAHRIAPKVATGVSALSPHPLSRWRERGPDGWASGNRERRSRGVRACKNRKAADPWLWLAGLAVCRKREGVPLPRSGGGREGANAPAAPYKHRLAHDPGRRSRSGRAFRCVGFLGRSPKPFLHPFVGTKGCPRRAGVLTKPSKRLAPPIGDIPLLPNGSRCAGAGLILAEEASPPEAEPYFFSRRKRRARPGFTTGSARAMSMASSGTSRVTVAPAAV